MAEGFKDFAPGDILTAADVDDYLMQQAVMVFADASARTTALSSVLREGMMSYLKDTDEVQVYDGTSWVAISGGALEVDFLIIGGGGGGKRDGGGGGGAGGYIVSYASEVSGGGGPNYDAFRAETGTNYAVTIGAGGRENSSGSGSLFHYIGAIGGGSGFAEQGGSGGGSSEGGTGGAGTLNQGYDGGDGSSGFAYSGGGGGGAGAAGQDSPATGSPGQGGNGGNGLASFITGSSVARGGGGGGGDALNGGSAGTGGTGGGGNGGTDSAAATTGTANTGGGGGGGGYSPYLNGKAGGSGVVILRYPNTYTITLGAGLTGTTTTDGSDNVTTITAGQDYVSWS